jgi:Domain of unknown function (DUF4113)
MRRRRGALFGSLDRERGGALMAAMDACNARFGRGAVVPARAGLVDKRTWFDEVRDAHAALPDKAGRAAGRICREQSQPAVTETRNARASSKAA